jgi:hypothetical protein
MSLRQIVQTAEGYNGLITAIGTVVMAVFTATLWFVTNKSVRLARAEFKASLCCNPISQARIANVPLMKLWLPISGCSSLALLSNLSEKMEMSPTGIASTALFPPKMDDRASVCSQKVIAMGAD